MKTRVVLFTALFLGVAVSSWADGELLYPWDNPPPAPAADCLDVPCVPCVFSLPGLGSLAGEPKPCRLPQAMAEAPTVAVRCAGPGLDRAEK